jgi:hypothetical protein
MWNPIPIADMDKSRSFECQCALFHRAPGPDLMPNITSTLVDFYLLTLQ